MTAGIVYVYWKGMLVAEVKTFAEADGAITVDMERNQGRQRDEYTSVRVSL